MAAESEPSHSAFDEFVDLLGPARHTEPAPTDLHDGDEAPFRITHPDGATELVDQNLAQLPFPASAAFTAEPVTPKSRLQAGTRLARKDQPLVGRLQSGLLPLERRVGEAYKEGEGALEG